MEKAGMLKKRSRYVNTLILSVLGCLILSSSGCGPDAGNPSCLKPFEGVSPVDVRYIYSESADHPDGHIAIAHHIYRNGTNSLDGIDAMVRLWDNSRWRSEKLATTDTIWRGPYFVRHGDRWHVAITINNSSTNNVPKTIYLRQKDDGTFGTFTVVQSLTPKDYLDQYGLAVGSDGRVAIVTNDYTYDNHPIYFSEKPATAGLFNSEQVKINGNAVEGQVKLAGYDRDDNPFIVYNTPRIWAGDYQPQEIRILRKRASRWTSHSVVNTDAIVAWGSISGVVTNDNRLVLSYATVPLDLGSMAQKAAVYDLRTDLLASNETVLEFPNNAYNDGQSPGYVSLFDVFMKTTLTEGGDKAVTFSSFRHYGGYASLYRTDFDGGSSFSAASRIRSDLKFVFNAGGFAHACGGLSALREYDTESGTRDPYTLEIVPLE